MSDLESNGKSSFDELLHALAQADAEHAYERGVLDVLRLLGLVERQGEEIVTTGEVAHMLLRSLWAHLRDGVRVGFDWERLDRTGDVRGVDLIRAVEAARVSAVPKPTPARSVRVAQAVVKTIRGGVPLYLMQYDEHAGQFQMLGGKAESGEDDLAETLRRELAEELDLPATPGEADCILTPLEADREIVSLSPTYGLLTRYAFSFYHVGRVRFSVRTDQDTCWLSGDEIMACRAADERPISALYCDALGGRLAALPDSFR
jgi:8-oxo-dGTP pyrophosphatase MutT (NUDIX family)